MLIPTPERIADEHVNHTMLSKNNKFLSLLLEAGGPSPPMNGSRAVANVYHKEKTPDAVNSAGTAYNTDTQEPVSQAEYQLARLQNSVYMDGFDHELNTNNRFDDMGLNSTDDISRDTAETLVNINEEQIANETMNFWRALNHALINGKAVGSTRSGYASKIYGLADLVVTTGTTAFGLTRATIGNHDFLKPSFANATDFQPRWSACVLTPISDTIRIYGDDKNSLTRLLSVMGHMAHAVGGSAAVAGEYAIVLDIGTYNKITDALKGSARWNLAEGSGAGADPNVSIWKQGLTLDQFNARFFVDAAMPPSTIYVYNRACVKLAQTKPTRTMNAGNIMGKWRLQPTKDELLLPMKQDGSALVR